MTESIGYFKGLSSCGIQRTGEELAEDRRKTKRRGEQIRAASLRIKEDLNALRSGRCRVAIR